MTTHDKEIRAAIGWTDIKKREQEVSALLRRVEVAGRRDELMKAAPHQVAHFFEIEASKLNASWYLEYVKLRDAALQNKTNDGGRNE